MLGPSNGANENQYLISNLLTRARSHRIHVDFPTGTRRMELSPLLVVSWNMEQLSNLSSSSFGMACVASRTP